jgi:hypothetical protein
VKKTSLLHNHNLLITVAGLLVLFLTLFSARLMVPKEEVTEVVANVQDIVPIGELLLDTPVEQGLNCPVATLKSLRLFASTFARANNSFYELSVLENGASLADIVVSSQALKDNSWIDWVFDKPIEKCEGKKLVLRIASEDAGTGNAITFFHRKSYYPGELSAPESLRGKGVQLVLELNRASVELAVKAAIAPIQTTAIVALPSDQLVAKMEQRTVIGEVLPAASATQGLVCPVTKLNSLRILAATYARTNKASYEFSILENGKVVNRIEVQSGKVKDNDWITWKLDTPINDCLGKQLSINLATKDAAVGNALTFYTLPTYYAGRLQHSGKKQPNGRQIAIELNPN